MTHVSHPSTPEEIDALRRRALSALRDAGLGDCVSAGVVQVSATGLSLHLGVAETRRFVDRLEDLAVDPCSPDFGPARSTSASDRLRQVFEEVHTVPTGYEAARILPRPGSVPSHA